jgi:hypothetical protein
MTEITEPETRWPELPLADWQETCTTLQLWTQVVGKIRLVLTPWLNHSWHVVLYVTTRGLTTSPIPCGERSFSIDFDFIDHRLVIAVDDGRVRQLDLKPRSVADFYATVMAMLDDLALPVRINPMPNEIPGAVCFSEDEEHASYDAEYAHRFWRVLLATDRVMKQFRSGFIGKASPVHFFWGSFDLAVTRFSGRPAPPREGPEFMRDAYSHEVISHGFWPGSGPGTAFGPGPVDEPAFYAYAVPEPSGFKTSDIEPRGAFYHVKLGEFILPYRIVQSAKDSEAALLAFVESSYSHAADLASWDRVALERPVIT